MSRQAFFVTKDGRRLWGAFTIPGRVYEIGSDAEFARLGRAYGRFQVVMFVVTLAVVTLTAPLLSIDGGSPLILALFALLMVPHVAWNRRAVARLEPGSRLLSEVEAYQLLSRFKPRPSFALRALLVAGLIAGGVWGALSFEAGRYLGLVTVLFGLLAAAGMWRERVIEKRVARSSGGEE